MVNEPHTASAYVVDSAVPEKRLAIYIDGAAFHVSERLRRDRWIRERLRNMEPAWEVMELRVGNLKNTTKNIKTIITGDYK